MVWGNGDHSKVKFSTAGIGSRSQKKKREQLAYKIDVLEQRILLSSAVSKTLPAIEPSVGSASQLVFGNQPTTLGVGAELLPSITVKVEDQSGDVITTDSSNVTLAIKFGPAGGTLSGVLTVSAVGGIATFTTPWLSDPGTYTLAATDGTLTAAVSSPITVTGSYALTNIFPFDGSNGDSPSAAPVFDSNGNLFGVTTLGGATNFGSVFEIANGSNSITTVASFNIADSSPDGPISIDSQGNIYGVFYNGTNAYEGGVFELAHGTNSIAILGTFNGNTGSDAEGNGLVVDSSGDVYGTTTAGGVLGYGNIFEIVHNSGVVTNLATFNANNGFYPEGTLAVDSSGDLFGSTEFGGLGFGVVYGLAKGSNSISTLASFNQTNGEHPISGVIIDGQGNLYGTATQGNGFAFEVTKGSASITYLAAVPVTSGYPSQILMDANGNLFVSTDPSNNTDGLDGGNVYEIPKGSDSVITIGSFDGVNGREVNGIAFDSHGDVWGTTVYGGNNEDTYQYSGAGDVFELHAPYLTVTAQPDAAVANKPFASDISVAVLDPFGNLITSENTFLNLTIGTGPAGAALSGTVGAAASDGIANIGLSQVNLPGVYTLIVNYASNSYLTGTTAPITVSGATASTIVARNFFYNGSNFDGNNVAGNASDLNAIATDKTALLPGGTATYSNMTDYSKGINGIIIDISNLPSGATLTPADFQFATGDVNDTTTWTPLTTSPTVTLLPASGGVTPVDLTWPNGTIVNTWLQVTVLADTNTGLASNDVSYFGNLIGKVSDTGSPEQVTALDLTRIENNIVGVAAITNPYDVNKDGSVDAEDLVLTQRNSFSAIRLITPTGNGPAAVTPQIVAAASLNNSQTDVIAPLTSDTSDSTVADLLGKNRWKILHSRRH
jgi:uncharacterized repeat protein (TIGR03803 family)